MLLIKTYKNFKLYCNNCHANTIESGLSIFKSLAISILMLGRMMSSLVGYNIVDQHGAFKVYMKLKYNLT